MSWVAVGKWGLLILLIWFLGPHAVWAQELPTATPDAEGRIYDVVQPGDNLYLIAARHGRTLAELLAWNNMGETDLLQVGQRLIVGYGPPDVTPTPEVTPTATPTRPPPTPTNTASPPPRTAVCLSAYNDANANSQQDPGEPLQAAVAFTLYTPEKVVANYVTDGVSEPYCLEVPPGSYQITRSSLPGEVLTNAANQGLVLQVGHVMNLAFGGTVAQTAVGDATPSQTPETAVTPFPAATTAPNPTAALENSELTGVDTRLLPLGAVMIGGLLLAAAIGLAVLRRRKS
jgi:LysM repeat protein